MGLLAALIVAAGGSACSRPRPVPGVVVSPARSTPARSATPGPSSPGQVPGVRAARRRPPGPPSDQRRLSVLRRIGGRISPKSVSASGTGLVFAQNMMYTHTITVYDSRGRLLKTIPDTVLLARFGVAGHPGLAHGAPVEAAFTPDGRYAYVSNYSMYGAGFGPEGRDSCTPASARSAGTSPSYVYRVDIRSLSVDRVLPVGLVPKFLAMTPDGRYLLVSNWCSYDVDVIDVAARRTVARIPVGPYPRGLAVSADSTTAYVAVMGSDHLVELNLRTLQPAGTIVVGPSPRHLVLSPDGRYLYASLNTPGDVVKVRLADHRVIARTHTGQQDRSLAIAADGRSLYVVNYASDTVTKLRAADLHVLQTLGTGVHPIGVTYDSSTGNVWVAVYSGQILVLADR